MRLLLNISWGMNAQYWTKLTIYYIWNEVKLLIFVQNKCGLFVYVCHIDEIQWIYGILTSIKHILLCIYSYMINTFMLNKHWISTCVQCSDSHLYTDVANRL